MVFPSSVDLMLDILLPSTDLGVAVQFLVVIGLFGIGLWRAWSHAEARLFVIGTGLVILGLMGSRALH